VARENARTAALEVAFEQCDVRDGLVGSYDLVVSNPPYVTAEEIEGLEPEVRDWEPRTATVGDDHTEVIATAAAKVLRPGGWLVLEVGDGRAPAVCRLLQKLNYECVRTASDSNGPRSRRGGQMGTIDEAVSAIRAGEPVILPMDTVYGLCADPVPRGARRAALPPEGDVLKRSRPHCCAPTWRCSSNAVPELRGRSGVLARAILPGPYTLIFPNPARRFRWLNGLALDTIGVRVPALEGPGREVLEQVGAVAATSANRHRWARSTAARGRAHRDPQGLRGDR